MISKRWQSLGVLAILAASLACSLPIPSFSAPIATPIPTPTQTKDVPAPKIKATPNPAPAGIRETVSALQSLNVREKSTYTSAVIGALYTGDTVFLTGKCSPGWAQIRYKSRVGWVNEKYITGDLCEAR